jgi:ribosome-associated heat shock protein Hsp15
MICKLGAAQKLQSARSVDHWHVATAIPFFSLSYSSLMSDPVRLDKWLWAARFFKTRSMATAAVDGGKVRLNDERVKPARHVKTGDVLDIDNGASAWQVKVRDVAEKRGSATIAQQLYEETAHSIAQRERIAEQRRYFREPGESIKGRPTKRDRRRLDRSAD